MKVKVNGSFVDVGSSSNSGGGDLSTAITISATEPVEPTPIWIKTPN